MVLNTAHNVSHLFCLLSLICIQLAEISELIASVSACDAAVQIAQGFLNWSSQCIDTFQVWELKCQC